MVVDPSLAAPVGLGPVSLPPRLARTERLSTTTSQVGVFLGEGPPLMPKMAGMRSWTRMIAFASVMSSVWVSPTSPVAGSGASDHRPATKNGRLSRML
jgi:hypothetical protein